MENKRSLGIGIGLAVLVAAGVAVWYLRRPAPEQAPQAQTQAEPPKPADAPLPPPAKSDAQMRKDLASLSPLPEWAQWIGASELLDRFVVVVDNVAEDVNPRKQIDFIKVSGQTSEKLDTARYDRIAAVIASIDAKGAAQVVRELHPLVESAYHKRG